MTGGSTTLPIVCRAKVTIVGGRCIPLARPADAPTRHNVVYGSTAAASRRSCAGAHIATAQSALGLTTKAGGIRVAAATAADPTLADPPRHSHPTGTGTARTESVSRRGWQSPGRARLGAANAEATLSRGREPLGRVDAHGYIRVARDVGPGRGVRLTPIVEGYAATAASRAISVRPIGGRHARCRVIPGHAFGVLRTVSGHVIVGAEVQAQILAEAVKLFNEQEPGHAHRVMLECRRSLEKAHLPLQAGEAAEAGRKVGLRLVAGRGTQQVRTGRVEGRGDGVKLALARRLLLLVLELPLARLGCPLLLLLLSPMGELLVTQAPGVHGPIEDPGGRAPARIPALFARRVAIPCELRVHWDLRLR